MGGRGFLDTRGRSERRGGCWQGNDGWCEAVEGLKGQVGRGCVEMVVSVLGGQKKRVPTRLFGAMARGDAEQSGVEAESSLAGCVHGEIAACVVNGQRY